MRSNFSKFALAATFGLAMTFTFSCSGDDGDDDSGSSSSRGGSSSSRIRSSGSSSDSDGGSSSSRTKSAGSSSNSGGDSCKDSQGRDYFCEWGSPPHISDNPGCYAISQENETRSCSTMVDECNRYGYLYINSTVAAGETCDGTPISSSSRSGGSSSSSGVYIEKGNSITHYRTTQIGSQTWMAENLDYKVEGSTCYNSAYDGDAYCAKYGRLYNWDAAMTACPLGWHLPSNEEWSVLVDFVGGERVAGAKLKATSGWKDKWGTEGNGTDDYEFAALPGGALDNVSHSAGDTGVWWSSSEDDFDDDMISAYVWTMWNEADKISYHEYRRTSGTVSPKNYMRSVRCIQN